MAAEVTGHLQKQAWLDRVLPPVEQVQPGLWSIPVEIPIRPLRYVLVYVLEHKNGIALIDSGWGDQKSYDTLVAGLAQGGYSISDVTDVLVTHMHPDHYGLAPRIRDESGARIALHLLEEQLLFAKTYNEVHYQIESEVHSTLHGVPDEDAARMKAEAGEFRRSIDHQPPDIRIEDGGRLDLPGWELDGIWTPGHTPGHMCFVDAGRKVMFTGDHVLPRITPNISVHSNNPTDALAQYIESLTKVGKVADTIAELEGLPGHEYRFAGIRARAEELIEHHEERLEELRQIVVDQPGVTSWEISQRLTWTRDWNTFAFQERRAALGEAIAHAELLAQRGVIRPGRGETAKWHLVEG